MQVNDVIALDAKGGRSYGRVLSVHTSGEVSVPGIQKAILATEDKPVILYAPFTQDDTVSVGYLKASTDPVKPSAINADPGPRKNTDPVGDAVVVEPPRMPPPPPGVSNDDLATFFIMMAMSLVEAD